MQLHDVHQGIHKYKRRKRIGREIVLDGRVLCRACAGEQYYEIV